MVLIATLFPALTCFLHPSLRPLAQASRELVANLFGRRAEVVQQSPREQLTSFAAANVGNSMDSAEHDILNRMVMVDVRSWHKTVVFEAHVNQKNDAVISALSTTNLPIEVIEKIAKLVGNTTLLV